MSLLESAGLTRFGIQLAAGGSWENALAVDGLSSKAITEWLTASGPDVSMESLFGDASGNRAGFIGFRRLVEHPQDRCSFWHDMIERTMAFKSPGPKEHAALWLELLGQPSLLASAPDRIELGVWNQWKSAGVVELPAGQLPESAIRDGPGWIRHGATAPIVHELQWMAPLEFWIGEVVSEKRGERYFLPVSMLRS